MANLDNPLNLTEDVKKLLGERIAEEERLNKLYPHRREQAVLLMQDMKTPEFREKYSGRTVVICYSNHQVLAEADNPTGLAELIKKFTPEQMALPFINVLWVSSRRN